MPAVPGRNELCRDQLQPTSHGGNAMPSALMVYGGWDGHEPKRCVDLFAPILQGHGFDVQLSDTLDAYLDAERMRSLDLIVPVWTMGTITKEQEAGLLGAVKGGVN